MHTTPLLLTHIGSPARLIADLASFYDKTIDQSLHCLFGQTVQAAGIGNQPLAATGARFAAAIDGGQAPFERHDLRYDTELGKKLVINARVLAQLSEHNHFRITPQEQALVLLGALAHGLQQRNPVSSDPDATNPSRMALDLMFPVFSAADMRKSGLVKTPLAQHDLEYVIFRNDPEALARMEQEAGRKTGSFIGKEYGQFLSDAHAMVAIAQVKSADLHSINNLSRADQSDITVLTRIENLIHEAIPARLQSPGGAFFNTRLGTNTMNALAETDIAPQRPDMPTHGALPNLGKLVPTS